MKNGKQRTAIVAGGAGFIGSHLCDALLADGFRVVCLDNLRTGRRQNLQHLARDARFDLVEADVIAPPPPRWPAARWISSSISPAPPRRRSTSRIPSTRC